jgi:hypothetical protein
MSRPRGLRSLLAHRVPRAVLLLGGLAMATIGSCTLPSIKPPSI